MEPLYAVFFYRNGAEDMSVRRTNGSSSTPPPVSNGVCANQSGKLAGHRISSEGTGSSERTSQSVEKGLKSCLKKDRGNPDGREPKKVQFSEYCTVTTVDDIDAFIEGKVQASKSPSAKIKRCINRIKNMLSSCFSPLRGCFRHDSVAKTENSEEISVNIPNPSDKSGSVSYSRALVTLLKQWVDIKFNRVHPLEARVPASELRELTASFEFLAKQVGDPELKKTFQKKAEGARKRLAEQENVEQAQKRLSSLAEKLTGLFGRSAKESSSEELSPELTIEQRIQQGFENNIEKILQTKVQKGMRVKVLVDNTADELQVINEEFSEISEEEIDDENDSSWSREDLVKMLFFLRFTLEQWGKQMLEGVLASKQWLSNFCTRCRKARKEEKADISASDEQMLQNLENFFLNKQSTENTQPALPRAKAILQSLENWEVDVLCVVDNEEPWYQVPRSVTRPLEDDGGNAEYVVMRACLKESNRITLSSSNDSIYVSPNAGEAIYEDMGQVPPPPPQSSNEFSVVLSCPGWLRSIINVFATGAYYERKTNEIEQGLSKPCVKRILNRVLSATGLLSAVVETDNQGGEQENQRNNSNSTSSSVRKTKNKKQI